MANFAPHHTFAHQISIEAIIWPIFDRFARKSGLTQSLTLLGSAGSCSGEVAEVGRGCSSGACSLWNVLHPGLWCQCEETYPARAGHPALGSSCLDLAELEEAFRI